TMRMAYTGSFLGLFNPFGLLAGVLGVAMLAMHGATYLAHKTEGAIAERARRAAMASGVLTVVAFALAGAWAGTGLEGYRIVSAPPLDSAFMPTAKTVARTAGAWMDNYGRWPATLLFPAMGLAGAAAAIALCAARKSLAAFLASGTAVAGIVLTAGAAMFPFIMPSSLDPGSGLTAWDAVASHKSLGVMFWVIVIMLPIVILYTSWVYGIMGGKVTAAYIRENEHETY
ncbi:MAG: cytochrome d ubiquinol oxidase subunit II, partial [Telluria sp.]